VHHQLQRDPNAAEFTKLEGILLLDSGGLAESAVGNADISVGCEHRQSVLLWSQRYLSSCLLCRNHQPHVQTVPEPLF